MKWIAGTAAAVLGSWWLRGAVRRRREEREREASRSGAVHPGLMRVFVSMDQRRDG